MRRSHKPRPPSHPQQLLPLPLVPCPPPCAEAIYSSAPPFVLQTIVPTLCSPSSRAMAISLQLRSAVAALTVSLCLSSSLVAAVPGGACPIAATGCTGTTVCSTIYAANEGDLIGSETDLSWPRDCAVYCSGVPNAKFWSFEQPCTKETTLLLLKYSCCM